MPKLLKLLTKKLSTEVKTRQHILDLGFSLFCHGWQEETYGVNAFSIAVQLRCRDISEILSVKLRLRMQ